MGYHLAQVTVARMHGTLDQPVMAGLVARIEEINGLAEHCAGFVWRLPGSQVTLESLRAFEGYFKPFEPERLFYNLSVWDSVGHLHDFVYKTAHSEMLRDKDTWIADFDRPNLALWWIPELHRPSVAESAERLHELHERGPTPNAFTFGKSFAKPAA